MSWVLNKVFQGTGYFYRNWWHLYVGKLVDPQRSQSALFRELQQREALREARYRWEIKEIETEDILDKALIKAKANKSLGIIDAPTYHQIEDKIKSLKKLKFTEDYEAWKDREIYEWMKYKVAAEVGGEEERAAFEQFEKLKLDQKGESGYRLWRDRIERDPQAQQYLPFF